MVDAPDPITAGDDEEDEDEDEEWDDFEVADESTAQQYHSAPSPAEPAPAAVAAAATAKSAAKSVTSSQGTTEPPQYSAATIEKMRLPSQKGRSELRQKALIALLADANVTLSEVCSLDIRSMTDSHFDVNSDFGFVADTCCG